MKAAAKRQVEFEKLQERKIHKEREEEGDLWRDKEVCGFCYMYFSN